MDAPILDSPDTSGLPANKLRPWGKLSHEGAVHPLADHCIDVAVTFQALLEGASLSVQHPVQQDRLAVLAFLHDLGKCNRGFQAKSDPAARDTAGHVMEALALLLDLRECRSAPWTRLLEDLCGWFASEEQALQMLVASISHHGRPVSLDGDFARWRAEPANRNQRRHWTPDAAYDPLAALDELARTARQAFPTAFGADAPPIDACPALQHRFAGLVMLADWIGSDTQFFRFRQSSEEDRLEFAQKTAARALQAIGLRPPEPRSPRPVEEVFPFRLTPLQAALAREIGTSEDTRLVLVESDTGSGKTEAALAWFFRLYANQKVDGLYFALPTRVAARELYDRVLHAVESAFEPDGRPGPVLLAVPGYVKVDGSSTQVILPDPQGNLWDDRARDVQRERLWSAERPKRFLAAPVAVGTIDQALLSVLQVKHSLLRSVCLDRHLLVVDEVHASDPYMREALRALLRGHLERGGWAMLLSATLGESAASLYFDREMASLEKAIERPYPLVTARSAIWPMPSGRERRIHLDVAPTIADDESLAAPLVGALRAGARVLVVCNTVARANALFRRMESVLKDSARDLLPALFGIEGVHCPHHGRFCREDRELLDATVTAQMGKRSPAGARLVIGTQTLEQSLDIDADWLVSDLAPMDVLVQRLGRLHRHDRGQRPAGFEVPRVLVRVPPKDLSGYLDTKGELRAPAGLGSVYVDGRVLASTWQELGRRRVMVLPGEARELIERTTHPEALDALPDIWREHGQQLSGKTLAEVVQALRSVIDDKPFGELHYADKSERILTRLGRPTFDIPLVDPVPSPFRTEIHRVAIPSHWLGEGEVPEAVRAEPTGDGFRFEVGNRRFRYTRFGLEREEDA